MLRSFVVYWVIATSGRRRLLDAICKMPSVDDEVGVGYAKHEAMRFCRFMEARCVERDGLAAVCGDEVSYSEIGVCEKPPPWQSWAICDLYERRPSDDHFPICEGSVRREGPVLVCGRYAAQQEIRHVFGEERRAWGCVVACVHARLGS